MKLTSFFNTNRAAGDLLKKYEEIAKNQEELILLITREREQEFTASELMKIIPNIPLTSIRRAICNLKKRGWVYETGRMKTGIYGRNERIYLPVNF